MRVAITDACIFIDLYDLKLTNHLFSLELEVHTSLDVFNELYTHQQDILSAFHSVGKLTIHNISAEDRLNIQKQNYPKSLSENDKTVLFIAEKIDAMILSSDKAVRTCAKKKSIEYHGMLWIFDKMVESGLLLPSDAAIKLKMLIHTNIVYQNNTELIREMEKRLKNWKS
jgi:predicted nucleic acid-binding protein